MSHQSSIIRKNLAKDCAQGIGNLLSAPDFAAGCSSPLELCKFLSDGEILCSLLAEISNGRVSAEGAQTTSFYSHNSQLLATRNIRYFLRQCQNLFGMSEQDLFRVEDLLNFENPERVVKCVLGLMQLRAIDRPDGARESGILCHVVQEFCNRERILAEKLMKLLLFRKELLGVLSEWSEDLVNVVFRYTEQLYTVHKEFHMKLSALAAKGCEHFCDNLGPVFAIMVPRLEIYVQYFSHLPTATERMNSELEKRPEMKLQLEMLEKLISKPETFQQLYDAPIRHGTNYLLLFDRLFKTAASEAPNSLKSVQKAHDATKALIEKANIYKRLAERTEATERVLSDLFDLPHNLARPADVGLLQADGQFRVRYWTSRDCKESRDLCHCILTTKQMMFVTSKGAKKHQLGYWFSVPTVKVRQVNPLNATSLEIVLDADARVKLTEKKGGLGSQKWLELLQQAIADCVPPGWDRNGHQFQLASFPTGSECSVCKSVLNGSVLQGYLCGQCRCRVDQACLAIAANSACLQSRKLSLLSQSSFDATEFFHPQADRTKAEALLRNKPNGAFLLRGKGGESSGQRVLSLKFANEVHHIEIFKKSIGRYALGINQERTFSSIEEMIDYYSRVNLSVHFSQLNCTLTIGVPPQD